MKQLIIFLSLISILASVNGQAPTQSFIPSGDMATAYRNYSDSTGRYLIKYWYNSSWAMVPATMNGTAHFDAEITVYRLINRGGMLKTDTVSIGNPFPAQYVPAGCYEDDPPGFVLYAKKTMKK